MNVVINILLQFVDWYLIKILFGFMKYTIYMKNPKFVLRMEKLQLILKLS